MREEGEHEAAVGGCWDRLSSRIRARKGGILGGFLLVSSQLGREGFMASLCVWNADGNGGEAGGGGLGEREREEIRVFMLDFGGFFLLLYC